MSWQKYSFITVSTLRSVLGSTWRAEELVSVPWMRHGGGPDGITLAMALAKLSLGQTDAKITVVYKPDISCLW